MDLFPVVTAETCMSVTAGISTQGTDQYLDIMSKEIAEENPYVWFTIIGLMDGINDEKTVLKAGVTVYKLLKSQAEADKLKKDFILK